MSGFMLVLELAIIAASGIDAKLRPQTASPLQRSWLIRWFYWHLAPLWAVWLGLVRLLSIATRACAQRAVERWRYEQAVALISDPLS